MRSIVLSISLCFGIALTHAQSLSIAPLSPEIYCSNGVDSFSATWSNIPANSNIVFYQSTNPAFNPYAGQGDSIGFIHIDAASTSSSTIKTTCPRMLGIFIDACNDNNRSEPANEYILMSSGNAGFLPSNLQIDLPANRDINTGGNPCAFQTPSVALMTLLRNGTCNAANLHPAGPSDFIPADALVIVFTGNGTDYPYNFSSLCSTGQPIYILQNACTQGFNNGSFANNGDTICANLSNSRYRVTTITVGGCSDELTFDRCGLLPFVSADPNAGDGNYVIHLDNTDTSSVANGGILNNKIDKCNGVELDSIIKTQTVRYPIPNDGSSNPLTNFCNTGYHYIKAITHPNGTQPISNSIKFSLICIDVNTSVSSQSFCSGGITNIGITSSDPNATFKWTVSGGANITGAIAGTGVSINQALTYNGSTKDSVIYTITATDSICTASKTVKVVVSKCSTCDSWLYMDQLPSYVTCGDLDIVGDKLTVECMFNKIPNPLTPHLVTKHTTAANINYALGPSYAEITTANNGYVILQAPCKPDSLKTYHVAMVYDGASLKFYSDGFLMASTPCSGALANNNILTTIGQINAGAGPMFEQHKGYINEVRIWNVARTQAQIRANMNSSLPSPATQPGLQGYYIFNDLLNKQGNAAYNATLGGSATINKTNPQCSFTADSCKTCTSPLQVTITGNTQICTGSSTTLTVTGAAGPFDSVRWSTNATTTAISVIQGGNYSVTVYKNGCRGDTFAVVTQKSCSVDTFKICQGDSVLLAGPAGYQHYSWTPSTGLSNDTLQSPKASPNSTTKYVVTGSNLGAVDTTEILKNGSFANNLQFWGTDLFALTPSCTSCNGWYDMTKTTWCNTPDHTPTDSILLQSSPTPDTSLRVLYQTITVKPNTTYSFSAWGMALTYNPAIFHVTINNDVVVNNFTLNATACTGWEKFTGTWFSGSNTTATLVIKDYMPDDNGNDFDLDDISLKEFAASGQVTDTFVVIVNPKPVSFTLPNDTTICGPVLKTLSTGNPATVWSTGVTASQITVNQPGKYWATVSNSCGTVSDTINITQSAGLNFSFGGNTSVCRGSSINLDAGSGYTGYLWSTGETTQSITIINPGKYWAQVTKNGCTGSDTIQVTQLDKPPVFSLGKDTVYCDTFTRVLSTGFTQTTWFRNNVQVTLGPSLTVTQAGTYIGRATNSCGSVYDTIVLSTSTPIVYTLGPDTAICPGKSIVLNATTAGPNIQYQWSTGEQTPTITVSQFNNYSVSVTNGLCTKSDTVFVDTIGPPRPIFLGNDTAYCGPFKILLFTGDNTIWSTGVTGTQITVDKPGTYIAENKNACGIEKDTIILKQYQLPFVNLGKDTTICDSVVLSIRNNNFRSVIWSTNESGNSIIVTETGVYAVTVADSVCEFTDSINIHKECLYDVYLPSAFTPNGDSINDVLVPLSPIKGITVLDFSVFDRWGERVYQSSNFPPNDKSHGWNGTYKGENSQQDSYGFYFSIKLPDNQVKTYKGTVSLLR